MEVTMPKELNLTSTYEGSLLADFYPKGWDWEKIDGCCNHAPETVFESQPWWHPDFQPVMCHSLEAFDAKLGHEIALEIRRARQQDRELILIVPIGPVGMYKWAVYFLQEWGVSCSHVHGFNMDDWSDAEGNTHPADSPESLSSEMRRIFYEQLGDLTVPDTQRHFATKEGIVRYPEEIFALQDKGAKLVTVYGIGRDFHIALWEPHIAAEFGSLEDWKAQTHRLGVKVHPLTAEQCALTSYKSRTSLVPCYGNTIGPGVFLKSDRCIGGCDGYIGRDMMWQGMSLWVALRYGPDPWAPATFMPTRPGRLFFVRELAGPLVTEMN